jgi:AcrR family transcriptional regulator
MATEATRTSAATPPSARMRILDSAYELFSHHGLRAVGIERIIEQSGVAKKTFYRHFPSKVDLTLAFLDTRGERWTRDWLVAEIQRLAAAPREQLLAVFDALDEWFHSDDFESCALIAALLEVRDKADPVHQAAVHQLAVITEILRDLARAAGFADPERLGDRIHILMMGAIVSATRGDLDAARRAHEVTELLLRNAG